MINLNSVNSDRRNVYVFTGVFLTVLLPLLFFPKTISRPVTALFLVLASVTAKLLIKKKCVPSIHKRAIAIILAVTAATLVALYYISGTFFHYYKNSYASTFGQSTYYIISVVLSIISFEVIRNIILAQESKAASVLITLAAITVDVLVSTKVFTVSTFNTFIDLVGLVVFPAVSANLFFNYISLRYGALPNVIYRLVITLYLYVIPVLPAMPDSLLALFRLLVPIVLYVLIDMLYGKKKKRAVKTNKRNKLELAGLGAVLILAVSLVMLISCQFKYRLLVIATGSMTGELNKGDAVVYEAYDGNGIEIGEIIVFQKGDITTVHRVINAEHVNGETRYYTKGDANDSPDSGYILSSNILGKVDFKLSYVGYPTLWMRDLFEH